MIVALVGCFKSPDDLVLRLSVAAADFHAVADTGSVAQVDMDLGSDDLPGSRLTRTVGMQPIGETTRGRELTSSLHLAPEGSCAIMSRS